MILYYIILYYMSYKNDIRILNVYALRELMKQKRTGTLNFKTWKPRIKKLNKYLNDIKNKRLKNLTDTEMNKELSLNAKQDFIKIAEFLNKKFDPSRYENRLTYSWFKSRKFVNKQLKIIKKTREILNKIKINKGSNYNKRKKEILKLLGRNISIINTISSSKNKKEEKFNNLNMKENNYIIPKETYSIIDKYYLSFI